MKVLIIGHRLGLARAIEKMNISYVLWTTKPILNALKAEQIIVEKYPESIEEFNYHCVSSGELTHVIAGVESSVISSSLIRGWLQISGKPHHQVLNCTDKLMMKEFLSDHKVLMTRFHSGDDQNFQSLSSKLGLPLVCKPKRDSGGRGIRFIYNQSDFNQYHHQDYYYEKMIKGKEGSVESLIQDSEILFSNITEYYKFGACNKVPAHFSKSVQAKILKLNKDIIKALNLKSGLTHLEYYINDDGVFFGEIAIRPPGGYIMDALALSYHTNFWEIYISLELGFSITIPQLKQYSASMIIHPGEGMVKSIDGIEEVEKIESLEKMKIKMAVGDIIPKREGVGQDYGYVLMKNDDKQDLSRDVDKFYEALDLRTIPYTG